MSREDWLAVRKTGLGGSDAAAVLGISPFTTPLELFREKLGLIPEIESNEAMEWGTRLEDAVARWYSDRSEGHVTKTPPTRLLARECYRDEEYTVFRHPEHEWMLATPDRFIGILKLERGPILEVKTTCQWLAKEWDSVPPHVLAQVDHYMIVCDAPWCDVAVLIGGQQGRIFRVEFDEERAAKLIEAERVFWQRIMDKDPPSGERAEMRAAEVAEAGDPTIKSFDMDSMAVVDKWIEAKASARGHKVIADELGKVIKGAMKDLDIGMLPDGRYLKWMSNGKTVMVKES